MNSDLDEDLVIDMDIDEDEDNYTNKYNDNTKIKRNKVLSRINNTSGITGFYFHLPSSDWGVDININGNALVTNTPDIGDESDNHSITCPVYLYPPYSSLLKVNRWLTCRLIRDIMKYKTICFERLHELEKCAFMLSRISFGNNQIDIPLDVLSIIHYHLIHEIEKLFIL